MRKTLMPALTAICLMGHLLLSDMAQAENSASPFAGIDTSDATLVSMLPRFSEGFVEANGIRLHYVEGGEGTPVILMPGWPQTWWAFHKIMPELAENHHVIAVDIRGMGASDKPQGGYDKKTMALDIVELLYTLGYEKAHIVGHDIGAQVAHAVAANHPDATLSVTFLDVPGLDDAVLALKLLPDPGMFTAKADPKHFFLWWFAFNQVKGLPEDLIAGRAHIFEDWFFNYLLADQSALSELDRAVYASAYNSRDAIRAGNGWYQAFPQDIVDSRGYAKLSMPALGIGGFGYFWIAAFLENHAADARVERLTEVGHYIMEEEPEEVTRHITNFLAEVDGR